MDIAVVGVSSHVVLAQRGKEFKAGRVHCALRGRPHAEFRTRGRRQSSRSSRLRRGHRRRRLERGPAEFRNRVGSATGNVPSALPSDRMLRL